MNDLTLICEICRFPIEGDTGAVYVTFTDVNAVRAYERAERHSDGTAVDITKLMLDPGEIHWRTGHYAHLEVREADSYEIDAARIATWPALARWTAHLMEKNWFGLSDWDDLLREVAGEIPSRRIRVAAKEAA